jgi:poly(beta-D-mannuronate) lyase
MKFMILLALVVLASATATAAAVYESNDHGVILIPAATPSEIINPDVSNDIQGNTPTGAAEAEAIGCTRVQDDAALGGSALRAPDDPHKQVANPELQESVAIYHVRFAAPGSYTLHVRARNSGKANDKSTDSTWVSGRLDDPLPTAVINIGPSGQYTWSTGPTYNVTDDQVEKVMTLRLGVREPQVHVDSLVLASPSRFGHADFEAMILGKPPRATPTPFPMVTGGEATSGDYLVATVDELHEAIASALPGQTIVMKSGRWENAVVDFDGRRTRNGRGGMAGAPIVLAAERGGSVVMTGQSRLRIAGEYMKVDGLLFTEGFSDGNEVIAFRTSSSNLATNCTLTNTAIVNFNPQSADIDYKWVSVYGTGNAVSNCWFSGMDHKGVTLTVWLEDGGPPNRTIIENCYFGDRAPGSGNGYETIRIGTSDRSMQHSEAIVRNNLFERCDGEIEVISNKSVGNRYIGNTFRECAGMLTIRHGTHCVVDGNLFLGNGKFNSGGVRLIGPGHVVVNNYFEGLAGELFYGSLVLMNGVPNSPLNRYLRTEDCLIAFNTFINNADTMVFGVESSSGDTTLPPRRIMIANNAIQTSGAAVMHVVNMPEESVWSGNIFDGGPLGADIASGFERAAPALQHDQAGIARPAPGSALIDAAVAINLQPFADMDGQPRPAQGADVGADEVSDAVVQRRPLTRDDVGPQWMRMLARKAVPPTSH